MDLLIPDTYDIYIYRKVLKNQDFWAKSRRMDFKNSSNAEIGLKDSFAKPSTKYSDDDFISNLFEVTIQARQNM